MNKANDPRAQEQKQDGGSDKLDQVEAAAGFVIHWGELSSVWARRAGQSERK